MHRSSESVAAIATALAKAQIELTNPEKSKVGSIYHTNRGDNPQIFRYATLSGGLEIIRKTLGNQQIAISQSTAIDQVNQSVNLTTTLMHTSGEWISSEWPVCQLSETAAPRRMGAALTYARRYALFTLVGIAGDDDPDLDESLTQEPARVSTSSPTRLTAAFNKSDKAKPPKPQLTLDESSRVRDQVLAHIQECDTAEKLDAEALSIFKAKNLLSPEDSKSIETAFQERRSLLTEPYLNRDAMEPFVRDVGIVPPSAGDVPLSASRKRGRPKGKLKNAGATAGNKMPPVSTPSNPSLNDTTAIKIDKSMLSIGVPKRHRDKTHLRFVALQPCLICGKSPSDPHHLRFAQPRALGRKTSDEFVVPLCRAHHRQNHQVGAELSWWGTFGIDPLQVALRLWRVSKRTDSGAR